MTYDYFMTLRPIIIHINIPTVFILLSYCVRSDTKYCTALLMYFCEKQPRI
jgi:hypothetical protein